MDPGKACHSLGPVSAATLFARHRLGCTTQLARVGAEETWIVDDCAVRERREPVAHAEIDTDNLSAGALGGLLPVVVTDVECDEPTARLGPDRDCGQAHPHRDLERFIQQDITDAWEMDVPGIVTHSGCGELDRVVHAAPFVLREPDTGTAPVAALRVEVVGECIGEAFGTVLAALLGYLRVPGGPLLTPTGMQRERRHRRPLPVGVQPLPQIVEK